MDAASGERMVSTAALRSWMYDTLAQLIDAGPLPLPPLPDVVPTVALEPLVAIVARLHAALETTPHIEVAIAQARLFVSDRDGAAAPPYASWYIDGRLFGPSSVLVSEAYARQGLEPSGFAGEPPDYVAVELQFMNFLCRHELAAVLTDDAEALSRSIEAQADFVGGHLARWLPLFVDRIQAAAPGPVFAAAADLADRLIRLEAQRFAGAAVVGGSSVPSPYNDSANRER